MAGKFCISLTRAKEDADRATVAFVVANAAVGCEQETMVFLSTEGVRLAVHALSQVYGGSYRRALQALSTFDRGAAELVRLHVPVLLVSGEGDRCTPPDALQALAQVLPDARHVSLPHVGHWPQLEDPEGFDGALLDFLASQRVLH